MLTTERLIIRSLIKEDAPIIEELASDYEIAKTTLSIPHPYPKGGALTWLQQVEEQNKLGKAVMYGIINKETNLLIGVMGLNLRKVFDRAELNYWIGKPHWGKGYASEAAQKLVSYCFEELHLNKVYAAAFTTNPGSWRVMEKIGMKHEGTFKQHVKKWEEYMDLTYYGMTREDYEEMK
ncbi:GNAT family N-acetyltransferase [Bacillus timonensis]|nr:GNAT family N-acetyltransferase [Bacillus timonensis]